MAYRSDVIMHTSQQPTVTKLLAHGISIEQCMLWWFYLCKCALCYENMLWGCPVSPFSIFIERWFRNSLAIDSGRWYDIQRGYTVLTFYALIDHFFIQWSIWSSKRLECVCGCTSILLHWCSHMDWSNTVFVWTLYLHYMVIQLIGYRSACVWVIVMEHFKLYTNYFHICVILFLICLHFLQDLISSHLQY